MANIEQVNTGCDQAVQRRIYNPIKHFWSNFLAEVVTGCKPLRIFAKISIIDVLVVLNTTQCSSFTCFFT